MLERALDPGESRLSRWSDLAGLANIATGIDKQTQSMALPRVLEIAEDCTMEVRIGTSMPASDCQSLRCNVQQNLTQILVNAQRSNRSASPTSSLPPNQIGGGSSKP